MRADLGWRLTVRFHARLKKNVMPGEKTHMPDKSAVIKFMYLSFTWMGELRYHSILSSLFKQYKNGFLCL